MSLTSTGRNPKRLLGNPGAKSRSFSWSVVHIVLFVSILPEPVCEAVWLQALATNSKNGMYKPIRVHTNKRYA